MNLIRVRQRQTNFISILVVGLWYEKQYEQIPENRYDCVEKPQGNGPLVDQHNKRLHHCERQYPRVRDYVRLGAIRVVGSDQLGGYEPRYRSQTEPEERDERTHNDYRQYFQRVLQHAFVQEIEVHSQYGQARHHDR